MTTDSFARLYVIDLELGRFLELSTKPDDRVDAVMSSEVEKKLRIAFGVLFERPPFARGLEIIQGLRDTDNPASDGVSVMTWARQLCNGYNPTPVRRSDKMSNYRIYWELRQRDVGSVN